MDAATRGLFDAIHGRAAADMSVDPKDALRAMEALSPFNRLLGIKGESADRGRVVLILPVRGEFVGDPQRPALHGGVLSSLIDTAGGAAAWSALATDESVSTVDLHVDYLEPAGLGAPLRAEAVLIRKGNRVCHVRVSVTQDGVLVAEGRGVYNIHRMRRDGTEPSTTEDADITEKRRTGRDE